MALIAAPMALAATIRVPGDVASLRQAIAQARPGDTIEVSRNLREAVEVKNKRRITIEAAGSNRVFEIEGNRSGAPTILIEDSSEITFEGFIITRSEQAGMDGGMVIVDSQDIVLERVQFLDNIGTIKVDSIGSNLEINNSEVQLINTSIIPSKTTLPVTHALRANGSDVSWQGGEISGNNGLAVTVTGGSLNLSSLVIRDNAGYGVQLNGGTAISFDAVTISGHPEGGILSLSSSGSISNSTIQGNQKHGLVVSGGSDISLNASTVSNHPQDGVLLI
ncbi:MAG TPA: right-handed parallel beta-helix repeat-containing protein, partial [Candidatus Bipolaricaulota bacterium]